MGSGAIQGKLWGQHPQDWAIIQEPTGLAGYEYVLRFMNFNSSDNVLDVGCGSGLFSDLVYKTGGSIKAIDASEALIAAAKKRNSSIEFSVGEMEELPFDDNIFSVVCGFNS